MNYEYSEDFKKLIEGQEKELLEGSHVTNASFADWERERSFIAKTIDHDGMFLDVGCANGFLERCISEWAKFDLTMYGIDIEDSLIQSAKKLFPNAEKNFRVLPLQIYVRMSLVQKMFNSFPRSFDYIYWNVWDNWKFQDAGTAELDALLQYIRPGGKLILGFYNHDVDDQVKQINFLEIKDYKLTVIKNENAPLHLAVISK